MNNLHEAYAVLQLQPGIPPDLINRQYKRLAMSWHPDKFRTIESKATAERELKKINNARDVLRSHFQSGAHRASGRCECEKAPRKADEPNDESQAHASTFYTDDAPEKARQTRSEKNANAGASNKEEQKSTRTAEYSTVENPFHNEFREKLKGPEANLVGRWQATKLCAAVLAVLFLSAVVSDFAVMASRYLCRSI